MTHAHSKDHSSTHEPKGGVIASGINHYTLYSTHYTHIQDMPHTHVARLRHARTNGRCHCFRTQPEHPTCNSLYRYARRYLYTRGTTPERIKEREVSRPCTLGAPSTHLYPYVRHDSYTGGTTETRTKDREVSRPWAGGTQTTMCSLKNGTIETRTKDREVLKRCAAATSCQPHAHFHI